MLTKDAEIVHMHSVHEKSNALIEELTHSVRVTREIQDASVKKERESSLQLALQMENGQELEARLEQTLMRWKMEKDKVNSESARCAKLRAMNAELIEKNAKQAFEIEKMSDRLGKYDHLPMPEVNMIADFSSSLLVQCLFCII